MRLRQVALVARDLEPVVDDLCAVLGVEVAYRDPGVGTFGLVNAVMPVGDTFLEVVSPTRPDTTAGRFLERRGGDGGYMVIVQIEDLDAARKRVSELGVRVVWEVSLSDAATIHLHPRDVGGAIVSLDWMDPPSSWRWAGPEWSARVKTEIVDEIAGVTVQADDPAAMASRWAEVFERPAQERNGSREIALDGGTVGFVAARDGRGDGVVGLRLRVRDRDRMFAVARERETVDAEGRISIAGVSIEPV